MRGTCLLSLAAAACAAPAAPGPAPAARVEPAAAARAEPAADCAAASFPDDRFISPSFTDKYNGRYHGGARQLDVWRRDQRLFAGPPGGPWRQLQRLAGEGDFRDGCGTFYRFVLPPDGPGGYVVVTDAAGRIGQWHRR